MPSRRAFLGLGASAILGAGLWLWGSGTSQANQLSAPEAFAQMQSGQLVLIDIRRPDEWNGTGIAQGAVAIDMRDPAFMEKLGTALGGVKSAPVALICARGVRSTRMAARMEAAGFSAVQDVGEGMLGSRSGPGWIARGLPIVRPQ